MFGSKKVLKKENKNIKMNDLFMFNLLWKIV